MSAMMVCYAPRDPLVCCMNYKIYYINGIFNPEKKKVEKEVIPLIKQICSAVTENIEVELFHNNTTPNLTYLVSQVLSGKLDEAKESLAAEIAYEISDYLNTVSNPIIIIGHSQGASVMDKVLGCLPHLDRVYAISIGGVHPIQSSGEVKICEFLHRMDWPASIVRNLYHNDKSKKPYFQIDSQCTDMICHSSDTYLTSGDVQKIIQCALQSIINSG